TFNSQTFQINTFERSLKQFPPRLASRYSFASCVHTDTKHPASKISQSKSILVICDAATSAGGCVHAIAWSKCPRMFPTNGGSHNEAIVCCRRCLDIRPRRLGDGGGPAAEGAGLCGAVELDRLLHRRPRRLRLGAAEHQRP